MLCEAVAGINAIEFFESRVAMRFGEDGCGGDGNAAGVAFDEGFLLDEDIELHGVDQEIVGLDAELLESGGHGLAAGLVDVPGIDTGRINFGYGPSESMFPNAECEFVATISSELFGVVEADDAALRIENDGSSDDRAE